jgi:hypothetical protein
MATKLKGKRIIKTFENPQIQNKIEKYLGKQHNKVFHSPVLFELGMDIGGGADVLVYKKAIKGITYITGDLIGNKQKKSDAGNYELMVCHKKDNDWGPKLISRLAYYTLEASLNSGETMDVGPFAKGKVTAIVFDKYCSFSINGKNAVCCYL